jgi:hypothetical protein
VTSPLRTAGRPTAELVSTLHASQGCSVIVFNKS